MGIFRMWHHGESDIIGTGSMNRNRGRWIYLNWSYGRGEMAVRSLGRKQIKAYSFLL